MILSLAYMNNILTISIYSMSVNYNIFKGRHMETFTHSIRTYLIWSPLYELLFIFTKRTNGYPSLNFLY